MIRLLRELVEIESPTGSSGVRRVAERIAEELEPLGAAVSFHGDHMRADLRGDGAPLLLLAHSDTVWEEGTLERMPFRIDGGRAFGPGAYDMKAGVVVMLAALRATRTRRAVRVFLTADEEVGSVTARDHLAAAAEGATAALVVEPPTPAGHLKTGRKGVGRFTVEVRGRAAHASSRREEGVNAIEELAHQVLRLAGLNAQGIGVSVNVGVVRGGTRENVVPERAEAAFDIRVGSAAAQAAAEERLRSLEAVLAGAEIAVRGGWTRPPLEPTPASHSLFLRAREHGLGLGLALEQATVGGGSDGNLVGALGVPVLDGLGAQGGGAHAVDEHVLLSSLPVRAALLARILEDPGLES